MKIYETIQVPASERTMLMLRKCDLCGRESKNRDGSWAANSYGVAETEIKVTINQRSGSDFPEGGSGTEYEIDLCPACFTQRLVPWLKEQGANIKEEEWGW